jgi:hypothetical protein
MGVIDPTTTFAEGYRSPFRPQVVCRADLEAGRVVHAIVDVGEE